MNVEDKSDLENYEDGLLSQSAGNIESCSSSILDSDDEDGINVTIKQVIPGKPDPKSPKSVRLKKGLCGSARRRLKRLMNDGMSFEEAREKAVQPVATPKRSRNVDFDTTNSSERQPMPKKCRDEHGQGVEAGHKRTTMVPKLDKDPVQGGSSSKSSRRVNLPAPTYQEIASRVKLGIIPKGYPEIELTSEQQETVKEALLKKVLDQRREPFKPKFVYCTSRTGYVLISCKDRHTADWVKTAVLQIAPWKDAELVALDEQEIPRQEVLLAFFYRSADDDNDTILGYIESQNDNLNTANWRILQRTVRNQHVEWAITVDGSSMRQLEQQKFVINYKYGQSLIRKKRIVNHPGAHEEDGEKIVGMEVGSSDEQCTNNVPADQVSAPSCSGTNMAQGKGTKVLMDTDADDKGESDYERSFSGKGTMETLRVNDGQGSINGNPGKQKKNEKVLQGKRQPIQREQKKPQEGEKVQQ